MSEPQPAPPPRIAAAIVAAMQAVTKIGKRGTNTEQNFRYRKYDDIITAAHDALVEAGLVILPTIADMRQRTREVTTRAGNARTVTTTVVAVDYQLICAEDASTHTIRYYGEASDYGDKSLGKACSYAEKMMLISVLKIPVESDDMDPDQHSHADDAPIGHGQAPRQDQTRDRRRPARARKNTQPSPPKPPAESDDTLHAEIIERLGVLSDDPETEGGMATLEKIWGDVERARLERNAWSVADHRALHAHVKEIAGRIKAAEESRGKRAAARMTESKPSASDTDPWNDTPPATTDPKPEPESEREEERPHPFAGLPGRDEKGERTP